MTSILMPRQCFAASNSGHGFHSYYGEVFSPARTDRLYVIKGGPGTGKSHFMKTVARRARTEGYRVTEYLCSSDPSSLDGLVLEREGSPTLGLLDGTPPHVWEPALPGARDELINLGSFWDGRRLYGEADTVRRLSEAKSAAYTRAYALLRAAAEADTAAALLAEPHLHADRIAALARRLLRYQPDGEQFEAIPALRCALGMTGRVVLHSFEAAAAAGGVLTVTEDSYGAAFCLTDALLAQSQKRRHRVLVSYHPLHPHRIDGLFYPDTGLCVLVGDAIPPEGAPARTLSLRRYADSAALRTVRGEYRHVRALASRLTEAALGSLADAAKAHFELERIYAAAMDFNAKEAYTEDFCRKLFGG